MRPTTADDYRARLDGVLVHVAGHLDRESSVAELAEIAALSPFPFHRIFRNVHRRDGRGPGAPAAAGGRRPAGYRPALSLALRLDPTTLDPRLEPLTGGTSMDVRIESLPERLAACVRHVGPYQAVGASFARLLDWAGPAGLLSPASCLLGLSYDNPETTAEAARRYDACLGLAAPPAHVPEWIRVERVPGGRYALHRLQGPYAGISGVFRGLFGLWLPASGEAVADRPCLEIYLNDPRSVPESALLTDIGIPLADRAPMPVSRAR